MPDSDNNDRSNERDSAGGRSGRRLSYPKRISLDVTEDDYHPLQGARYADRVAMADRTRALLSLWQEDPALAEAVSTRAQEQLLAAAPQLDQPSPPAPVDGPAVPPAS